MQPIVDAELPGAVLLLLPSRYPLSDQLCTHIVNSKIPLLLADDTDVRLESGWRYELLLDLAGAQREIVQDAITRYDLRIGEHEVVFPCTFLQTQQPEYRSAVLRAAQVAKLCVANAQQVTQWLTTQVAAAQQSPFWLQYLEQLLAENGDAPKTPDAVESALVSSDMEERFSAALNLGDEHLLYSLDRANPQTVPVSLVLKVLARLKTYINDPRAQLFCERALAIDDVECQRAAIGLLLRLESPRFQVLEHVLCQTKYIDLVVDVTRALPGFTGTGVEALLLQALLRLQDFAGALQEELRATVLASYAAHGSAASLPGLHNVVKNRIGSKLVRDTAAAAIELIKKRTGGDGSLAFTDDQQQGALAISSVGAELAVAEPSEPQQ